MGMKCERDLYVSVHEVGEAWGYDCFTTGLEVLN